MKADGQERGRVTCAVEVGSMEVSKVLWVSSSVLLIAGSMVLVKHETLHAYVSK